jgi:hypothetical protein
MKRRRRQEGAALFVVLMIVMAGTASAVFSANSVSHEVRGTGFARLQMQTRNAARAGLIAGLEWFDVFGPLVVRDIMQTRGDTEGKAFSCVGTPPSVACYPEPPLANGRRAYRLYPDHFDALVAEPVGFETPPILADMSFGPGSAHEPEVFVDLYDEHLVTKALAGAAVQGGTKFQYMRTTMTARGHAQVVGGDVTDANDIGRNRNEAGANMRGCVVSGPFMSSSP